MIWGELSVELGIYERNILQLEVTRECFSLRSSNIVCLVGSIFGTGFGIVLYSGVQGCIPVDLIKDDCIMGAWM